MRLAKRWLRKAHLDGLAREIVVQSEIAAGRIALDVRRKLTQADRRLVEKYFREHQVRKLHLGCGPHLLPGWLNTDLSPDSPEVLCLDATARFPLASDELDYVFSEHMIEHISFTDGQHMLAECFRVLRREGKVRISTPDLPFLLELCREPKSDLQRAYLKWSTEHYVEDAPFMADTFVFNNFVRSWGHKFIYDDKTLRWSLEQAGFTAVTKCELLASEHEVLRDLENDKRMPPGLLKLETLTLEGTKL